MKTTIALLTAVTLCTQAIYAEEGECVGTLCRAYPQATGHTTLHGYKEIDTRNLKELIDSKKPIILIDARTAEHDDGTRIPGAINLPYNATSEQIASKIPQKEALVVVYCSGVKCPASKYLAETLVKQGYSNVLKYPEGIDGWMQAGYNVSKTAKGK